MVGLYGTPAAAAATVAPGTLTSITPDTGDGDKETIAAATAAAAPEEDELDPEEEAAALDAALDAALESALIAASSKGEANELDGDGDGDENGEAPAAAPAAAPPAAATLPLAPSPRLEDGDEPADATAAADGAGDAGGACECRSPQPPTRPAAAEAASAVNRFCSSACFHSSNILARSLLGTCRSSASSLASSESTCSTAAGAEADAAAAKLGRLLPCASLYESDRYASDAHKSRHRRLRFYPWDEDATR